MRPASGTIPAESGRLYYERAGRGPAVILIHPGLWDSRLWDAQFASLAKQHDVIRYDLRGSGRSEPASAPYSDVQDLLEVMVFLDVERATLVGLSVGAAVAVDFALSYPEMVAGLVPVSTVLSGYEWQDPRSVGFTGDGSHRRRADPRDRHGERALVPSSGPCEAGAAGG